MINFDFKPEWIENFIDFVQCQKISLNNSNVLCLNYLSNIYEVNALQKITNEYISANQENLVLKILCQNQSHPNFKTSKYEEIISNKIEQFIEYDELLDLNLSILKRIFTRVANQNNKLNEKLTESILNFLMKCLDKHGRPASSLFSDFDIVKSSNGYLDRIVNDYSDIFDFNFLNKRSFINLYIEKKKQESEHIKNEKEYQSIINEKEIKEKQILKEKEQIENDKKQILNENEQIIKENEQLKNDKKQISNENEQLKKENDIIIFLVSLIIFFILNTYFFVFAIII